MILRSYIKNLYIVNFDFKVPTNSLKSWCNISEKQISNVKVTWPISMVCNKILWFILSSLLWKATDVTRCSTLLYFYMWAVLQCSEIWHNRYKPILFSVHDHVWGKHNFNQIFFSGFLFFLYKSFSLQWNLYFSLSINRLLPLSSSSLLEMFGLTSKEKNMSTPEHLCPHRVLWWQWYTPFTSVTLSWTLMLSAFKDLTPQGKRIQVKNVDLCLTHSLLQEHLAAICSRVKNQTHKVLQSSEPCLHNHIQNKY